MFRLNESVEMNTKKLCNLNESSDKSAKSLQARHALKTQPANLLLPAVQQEEYSSTTVAQQTGPLRENLEVLCMVVDRIY